MTTPHPNIVIVEEKRIKTNDAVNMSIFYIQSMSNPQPHSESAVSFAPFGWCFSWLFVDWLLTCLKSCWPRWCTDLEVTSGMQCGTAGSKINATGWCCFNKSTVLKRVVSPHLMSHSFTEAHSSFWDATGSKHFCCLCSNLNSLQFNLKNPKHFLSAPQGAKRFL